jgi:catechol 2,3-dioxygenase-like lactoylglutathione lyase family enzyme
MRTYMHAKAMAHTLRESLAERSISIPHNAALEIVARQFGVANWNVLSAQIERDATPQVAAETAVSLDPAIPMVRIFDVDKARDFYLGYLGFEVEWEHRFHDDAPLYMAVARGGVQLHLSEHSGDASPGGNMVVFARGLAALHAELMAKPYRYNRPGLESQGWGLEMRVTDPFSNRIRFIERQTEEAG